jgi:hypothetical protein
VDRFLNSSNPYEAIKLRRNLGAAMKSFPTEEERISNTQEELLLNLETTTDTTKKIQIKKLTKGSK